jgi:hypothetical protein
MHLEVAKTNIFIKSFHRENNLRGYATRWKVFVDTNFGSVGPSRPTRVRQDRGTLLIHSKERGSETTSLLIRLAKDKLNRLPIEKIGD